jgi:hypothetical protein
VSPTGEVLQEIPLVDLIYDSGYEGLLFADRRVRPEHSAGDHGDLTHINDIETLSRAMASAYKEFREGDILVSMRILDALIVVDPNTHQIKWATVGPLLRQHDPDFLPNGRISVFDNRWADPNKRIFSRIVELDPVTNGVHVIYEGNDENPFFTALMGKHQRLANGNILITESQAGRAFEVTPAGKVVWEFINRWDDDHVIVIGEATRYPPAYRGFIDGSCHSQ